MRDASVRKVPYLGGISGYGGPARDAPVRKDAFEMHRGRRCGEDTRKPGSTAALTVAAGVVAVAAPNSCRNVRIARVFPARNCNSEVPSLPESADGLLVSSR